MDDATKMTSYNVQCMTFLYIDARDGRIKVAGGGVGCAHHQHGSFEI